MGFNGRGGGEDAVNGPRPGNTAAFRGTGGGGGGARRGLSRLPPDGAHVPAGSQPGPHQRHDPQQLRPVPLPRLPRPRQVFSHDH